MKSLLILALLTLATLVPLAAQSRIVVERDVSQTSVWPGDRLHYRITLNVPANVRVALEDFDARNVNFEPFVLEQRTQEVEELDNGGVRYHFDYTLANFEIGDQQVEIPPLSFRYEQGGTAETNEPTTQEMRISEFPVAVRTTLNRPVEESWIEETLEAAAVIRAGWTLVLAGLLGLVISSFPLGMWVWRQIPNWQARRAQLSRKKFLRSFSDAVRRLEKNVQPDGDALKEQYRTLEDLMHGYIEYFWPVHPRGLTPSELTPALAQAQVPPQQQKAMVEIFDHGCQCRYSPPDAKWAEQLQQDLARAKKLKG